MTSRRFQPSRDRDPRLQTESLTRTGNLRPIREESQR